VIAGLRNMADRILGRGEAAITIPPFDGALKPNQLLEQAEILAELEAPEDLATDGTSLFVADGPRIWRYDDRRAVEVAHFERPVTALACLPGGGMAVALDGREVRIAGGAQDGRRWDAAGGRSFHAVNALWATADGRLLVTDGSLAQPCEKWCHDLMELGRTGRLIELDFAGAAAREIATGLAYAFGACTAGDAVWVSESWRHRLRRYGGTESGKAVLDRLPGYPSRIAAAAGGGFWLTVFTARTQLVEFVLREPAFRKRMMREIEPAYWVAPALSSGNTYLEPMQGAHIKTMGILKPWAPPRSYGLVIRLAPDGLPRYSLHSRVDGKNHGVVAAAECGGTLFVLAKGPRRLLRLSVAEAERSLQR
jgi:sugar lactone lactonase YvrE